MQKITVIGIGRLGLCTALIFEKFGFNVLGVDIFPDYVNNDSIVYCKIEKFYWENILKELINDHIKFTNSIKAKEIVRDWANEKKNFWQVVPKEIINQLEKPMFDKKNIDLKKKLA